MNPLDLIALIFIPVMIIFAAAGIVFLGSLPGKIARKRQHPWPDAVNAALKRRATPPVCRRKSTRSRRNWRN